MTQSPKPMNGLTSLQLNCQLKNGTAYSTLRPTKLDEIKNLHSTDSIDTENSGTRERSIWIQAGKVRIDKWLCHLGLNHRLESS